MHAINRIYLIVFILIWLAAVPSAALGAEMKATHFRMFGGSQSWQPDTVNSHIKAAGIDEFKTVNIYGLELSYRLFSLLNVGFRYVGKWQSMKETASPPVNILNPYFATLQQSNWMLVARLNLIESNYFMLDAFGGGGIASMKLDIRTSAGEGSYEKPQSSYATVSTAGLAAGFGWSNIFFFLEGGQEWSTFTNLERKGTTSSTIDTLDTGGSYFMVGLNFKGLPGFVKMK